MKALNNFLMLLVALVVFCSLFGIKIGEQGHSLSVFIKEEPTLKMLYFK
ncbi:hypothetical membrane protein [Taylorella asinigenitalis 14/45]|uniref:Uncharacterized protein n=2 Tax=Taylorella asinigenitalis TaxID=84590 RepID=G4QAM0_TAYAM|nr:hypothetical protein [Taylorella asinigenitalis]AEP36330.1 hypothetical protein TASI_0555 [Taylorella asinigenitalis MCE3]CCG19380.1 hypothetical membrane protein [Taylorella asinigenitalis 14/45]